MKNRNRSTLSQLFGYISGAKKIMTAVLFSALAAGIFNIASPFFIGKAIDRMKKSAVDFSSIFKIILLLAGLYIGYSLFSYILGVLSNITAQRVVQKIRTDAFGKLSKLALSFYDKKEHGDIISRFVNDCDAVSEGLLHGVSQLFSGVVTIVGTLIFMLLISPAVTLAVILISSLTFLMASFITRLSNKHFRNQQILVGSLSGYADEYIRGVKTVKAFSHETQAQKGFEEINQKLYYAGKRAQFAGSLTNPTTRLVNNLALISVAVFGGIIGRLSPGELSSFVIYATMFARPFNDLTSIATQIMAAYAACVRVFEIINAEPEKPDAPDAIALKNPEGRIDFKNVGFSYNKSQPLIQDVNLSVKRGNRIAIVGPTGAGKTTIVNLLMRFYDVDNGEILIDDININQIARDSLRRSFGMVLQETWLFKGSVRENIRYGRPDATDEEVVAAAKEAHAHSFIKRLPHGYDTVIGGDGSLSAGQMQLLTIARVMLCDPSMLLLDEATSSIDTLTERRISRAFDKMMEGKTSFIIAHRLSTIEEADVILVMDAGKIVEQGSHTELLEKEGFYYKLYNSQFAGQSKA